MNISTRWVIGVTEIIFSVHEPLYDELLAMYRSEYSVTGLIGTKGPRYAISRDPLESLLKAIRALTVIANFMRAHFEITASDNGASNNLLTEEEMRFPIMPDVQAGVKLYGSANFGDALPCLFPYAQEGIGEMELLVGSALFLWRPSDAGIARAAFVWCERAGSKGIGQAYAYMADICKAFPEEMRDQTNNIPTFIASAKALGYIPPTRTE